MSYSYQVYVGPYIEAPSPLKTVPRAFLSCPTKKCFCHKQTMHTQFCPQCGSKIVSITVESKDRIDFYAEDETEERLCGIHSDWLPNTHKDLAVFLPNKGNFGVRLDDKDSYVGSSNGTIMLDEVSRFKSYFAKDIARLNEVFGETTVHWGVVAYSS